MSWSKKLDAMRANPAADWTIADVAQVCAGAGIMFRKPKRGSHHVASHPTQRVQVTVPARRPVKAAYIRKVVELADAVLSV